MIGLLGLFAVALANAQTASDSPRLLVHLLDYLAKDYGGAVVDGKIVNAGEYQEQVEFARSALSLAREIPEINQSTDIVKGIEELNEDINSKKSAEIVSALALRLKERAIAVAGITQAPSSWPSLKRGRELYRTHCTTCHGETGAGDGPAGSTLEPRPANFLSQTIADEITPFRASNAIRLGVPNTAMVAWPMLGDDDVWDLAFYVTSLHIAAPLEKTAATVSQDDLFRASSKSDAQLMQELPGDDKTKRAAIAAIRLHSVERDASPTIGSNSLGIARNYLTQALRAYEQQDFAAAKQAALLAYLEGIEPVEPRLRARDTTFVNELEMRMGAVRAAIESRQAADTVRNAIDAANQIIGAAEERLGAHTENAWVTFVLTLGILIREGFEAVLVLIAFLAVTRASDTPKATRWLHAGWIGAVGLGFLSWFFSGWLIAISGAQREMLEGVTALLAVATLLYVGFWLHSRTEISRWKNFIEVQVKVALQGSNLWGLAAIAFLAVFREAFETVLFLRAVTLEGGDKGTLAMGLGVLVSFALLFVLSAALLKYSARVPIRRIFTISSALMAVLCVVLVGKGVKALQETGFISVTSTPWTFSWALFGIYPAREPILAQLIILAVVAILWAWGARPHSKTSHG